MSLTDDDWRRIRYALAFRSTTLCEQGASLPSPIQESCYAEARRYDEIIPKVRDFLRATGWQPIETAPKDGTDVLLLQHKTIHHAQWGMDHHGTWVTKGRIGFVDYPTHWMPLPEPPKGGGE